MPEIGRLEAKNTPIIIQTLRKTHQKKKNDFQEGLHKKRTEKGLTGFKDMKIIVDLSKSHFII